MLLRLSCLLVLLLPLLCGCKSSAAPPPPPARPQPPARPGEVTHVAKPLRNFAFTIFSRLYEQQPKQNLFVSPLSISMALHLLANGAAGETRAAIMKTLAAEGVAPEAANAELKGLRDYLETADPEVKLAIADSVWARREVPLERSFVEVAKQSYDAEVAALDFGNPASAARINDWVKQKTAGLIPRVIDAQALQQLTLVLLDAVYFKGRWVSVFSKGDTKDAPFYLLDGTERQVPMMSQKDEFSYAAGKFGQTIRLPYGRGGMGMYVLLPDKTLGLAGVMAALNPQTWEEQTAAMHHAEGTIKLPRFTARYDASLNEPLSALGMGVAFDPERADLSGLSKVKQWVDLIRHTSYLKVDEEGTEAAAVTEIGIAGAAAPGMTEPFEMIVDRPFLLLIEDGATGTVLFMGAIVAPEK